MATALKAICRHCERRFKNAQAVRAHLKYCRIYRLSPPPAAPGSRQTVPKSGGARENGVSDAMLVGHSVAYRRRRASNESLLTLLSAGEDLWELIKEAAGHCSVARRFDGLGNEAYHSEEWEQLVRELVVIHRESPVYPLA